MPGEAADGSAKTSIHGQFHLATDLCLMLQQGLLIFSNASCDCQG